jgi:hypothetical protein
MASSRVDLGRVIHTLACALPCRLTRWHRAARGGPFLCHLGACGHAEQLEFPMRSRWHAGCYHFTHMPWSRFVASASVGALLLAPAIARAQSVTAPTGYTPARISPTPLPTRPAALNPQGINYADCVGSLSLKFDLTASGFSAGQLLQVWVGPSTEQCGLDSERTGTSPPCWQLAQQSTGLGATATPVSFTVSAQAIVRGSCTSQPTSVAIPMTVWFIPTDASGHLVNNATVYGYNVLTDLVGPDAPSLQPLVVSDKALTVNWTSATQTDVFGYNVYADPRVTTQPPITPTCPPSDAAATTACLNPVTGFACDTSHLGVLPIEPDAGTPESGASDGSGGGDAEAGVAASEAGAEAGLGDEAGVDDASGTGQSDDGGSAPVGGIGLIDPGYLVNPSSPTNMTVTTSTTHSYQVTGLVNGAVYNVVVAAVDGSGNVGPASTVLCDYPQGILDYYETYGADGGRASGCALEGPAGAREAGVAAGAAGLLILSGVVRRRRRRRGH